MPNANWEKALVSLDRKETDKAIGELVAALDEDFDHAEAAFALSCIYLDKGHPGLAAILARFAIRARPDQAFPEALRNLGSAFRVAKKPEQAFHMWQMGIEAAEKSKEPMRSYELAMLYGSIAGAMAYDGDPHTALGWSQKALECKPGYEPFLYNQSLAELALGDWENGWKHYELGFHTDDRRARKYGTLPEWDGSPGKTVIVWADQGLGDEILFASCLPDMVRHCKKVIVDCHPRLVGLFQRSFPECTFHGTRKVQSELSWLNDSGAEASCCITSLMTRFRKSGADYPRTPFLKVNPSTIPTKSERPKIGISWHGGTDKTRMDLRRIPLDQWLPLVQAVDADWYSLQYGDDAARHVCAFEEDFGTRIKHYAGWVNCQDYDKTATFVASMDLVISVTTALVHLAGALGVPCWTLVPNQISWQYGKAFGSQSPFYQSVVLYRQHNYEKDWSGLMTRIAADLKRKFA